MELNKLNGFIFDMDGVVFNTEEMWRDAYAYANGIMGSNVTEEYRKTMCGRTRLQIIECIGNDFPGLDALKYRLVAEEYVDKALKEGNFDFRPNFLDFVEILKEKNIKIALATSATRVRTEFMFKKKELNKEEIFDSIVCGEDADGHSKPDPYIFEKAAKNISLKPEECAVVEDSINGLTGAYNGGFTPIMNVDLIEPNEYCQTHCKYIVRGFCELISLYKKELLEKKW